MGDHYIKVSLLLDTNPRQHGGSSQAVRHLVVSQASAGSIPVCHPLLTQILRKHHTKCGYRITANMAAFQAADGVSTTPTRFSLTRKFKTNTGVV